MMRMAGLDGMRVAIVFINIGGYHAARLQAAHASCRSRGWELIAVQVTNDTLEHSWGDLARTLGMETKTLMEVNPGEPSDHRAPFTRDAAVRMTRCLDELRPDAVLIPGWSFSVALAALQWCRRQRKIAMLASESNEFDAPRKWWREVFKGWRVRQFSSALVGGKSHARYLAKLGFDPGQIASGYDVVDNEAFDPQQIRRLPAPCPRPYFLTVCRFVAKKNLPFLLDSYAAYRQECQKEPWDWVLCGSGQQKGAIEERIAALGLTEFVHRPGFLKPAELLPYFAHAKCLVHASIEEQWGLVVNEALAAGLPVLVSRRCGCFEDLVVEYENGFGFDPFDREALTGLLLKTSSGEFDLEAMGRASFEWSKRFPASLFGEGLVKAVELGAKKVLT